jgi:hypothetical protein
MTSKTKRQMHAIVVVDGNLPKNIALEAKNLNEAIGQAITSFGVFNVESIYDPFTGDRWANPACEKGERS